MSRNMIALTVYKGLTRAIGGPAAETDCLDWIKNTNFLNVFFAFSIIFSILINTLTCRQYPIHVLLSFSSKICAYSYKIKKRQNGTS